MSNPESDALRCPVGEPSCPVIDEVARLRQALDEMAQLIHTDPLTGLNNYRFMRQALEQEIERTRRTGHPTGFMMIDLDHFKQVNDTWGHEVGNQALRHAAKIIRASVRKIDIPCRYGGEEFAVILPATDFWSVIQVAERVRAGLEQAPLPLSDKPLQITASIGIAMHNSGDTESAESLIRRADAFLYEAKSTGRNRVCYERVPDTERADVSDAEKDALFDIFKDNSE